MSRFAMASAAQWPICMMYAACFRRHLQANQRHKTANQHYARQAIYQGKMHWHHQRPTFRGRLLRRRTRKIIAPARDGHFRAIAATRKIVERPCRRACLCRQSLVSCRLFAYHDIFAGVARIAVTGSRKRHFHMPTLLLCLLLLAHM